MLIFNLNKPKKSMPNVLLITLDALRPDHLSCYGYERETSPNINRLANEGALFTQVIAQSSTTFYSVPSFIFSKYPVFFETDINSKFVHHRVRDKTASLIEILMRTGYKVGVFLFRSIPSLFPIYVSVLNWADEALVHTKPMSEGHYHKEIWKDTEETNELVLKFIEENKEKPFFLWVFYHPPHAPYVPPPRLQKMFIGDHLYKRQLEEYGELSIDLNLLHSINGKIPLGAYLSDHKEYAYYVAQYDAYIRFIDEKIGQIINVLEKLNLYRDTLIIVHSDHGELMGEHNRYFSHGEVLYDALLKVPLIMKYHSFSKKEIESQIELMDLAPTILDVLSLPIPGSFEGKSFKRLISGEKEKSKEFAFSLLGDYRVSLRTPQYKLIKNIRLTPLEKTYGITPPKYEFYNIEKDPSETTDIRKDRPSLFLKFKEIIDDFENSTISKKESLEKTSTLEKLKSLGYVQ